MRSRCALFLALLAAASAVVAGGASAAAPLPGSDYVWAQPWATAVSVPCAQPAAWIPLPTPASTPTAAEWCYVWAQPGTSLVGVPSTQPPAWIPTQ
jgi:hypothetical protein